MAFGVLEQGMSLQAYVFNICPLVGTLPGVVLETLGVGVGG